MTRARLRFPAGDPIEVELGEVVAYGPEIGGFRAWLGAVSASDQGRWLIRFADESVLGFQRSELKRIRVTPTGADIILGDEPRTLTITEHDVVSFGPEPEGPRAWLGEDLNPPGTVGGHGASPATRHASSTSVAPRNAS